METALRLGIDSTGATRGADEAKKGLDSVKQSAEKTVNAVDFLKSSLKTLGVTWVAMKILDHAKDIALLNARYETLGVVLQTVGRNAQYTSNQMNAFVQSVQSKGIAMVESRQAIIQMTQAEMDLTKASQLARVAQDAAVIGGINSSEAFTRMISGIQKAEMEILDTIGLRVNFEAGYNRMAASLRKTTAELTDQEKVQSRMNEVFRAGVLITGAYEASMDTAGKQITSMNRYIDDLKVKGGEVFNETLTVGVLALTRGLQDANGEIDEMAKNKQLQEWGQSLVEIFVELADVLNNLVEAAKFGYKLATGDKRHAALRDQEEQERKATFGENWMGGANAPVDFNDMKKSADIAEKYKALHAQIGTYWEYIDQAEQEGNKALNRFSKALADRRAAVAKTESEGSTASISDFVMQYKTAADIAAKRLKVDPNMLLSQWGLETGWGKSVIPGTNNLGNIKDFSGAGVSAKDNATGSVDKYKVYSSPDQFAEEYANMIMRKYPQVMGQKTAEGFATALKQGGYAEDPKYVDKISSIYNRVTGQANQMQQVFAAKAEAKRSDAAVRMQKIIDDHGNEEEKMRVELKKLDTLYQQASEGLGGAELVSVRKQYQVAKDRIISQFDKTFQLRQELKQATKEILAKAQAGEDSEPITAAFGKEESVRKVLEAQYSFKKGGKYEKVDGKDKTDYLAAVEREQTAQNRLKYAETNQAAGEDLKTQERLLQLTKEMGGESKYTNAIRAQGALQQFQQQKDLLLQAGMSKIATQVQGQLERELADARKRDAIERSRDLLLYTQQMDQQVKQMEFETQLMGKNTTEREKAIAGRQIELKIKEMSRGATTAEIEELLRLQDVMKNQINKAIDDRKAKETDMYFGINEASRKYLEDAGNQARQFESLFSGTFSRLEDALVGFVKTGKFEWAGLVDFMITELIRMQIKSAMSDGIKALTGGGGMGDWIKGLFGGGGAGAASAAGDIAGTAAQEAAAASMTTLAVSADTSAISMEFAATGADFLAASLDIAAPSADIMALSMDYAAISADMTTLSLEFLMEAAFAAAAALEAAAVSSTVSSAFADGGIMTSYGSMPLKKYASGGVASFPQIALYGEGSRPEAIVPLPDGRSIPVMMQGDVGGGGVMVNVSVVVNNDGTSSSDTDTKGMSDQFGQQLAAVVANEIVKQQRPGGLLYGK